MKKPLSDANFTGEEIKQFLGGFPLRFLLQYENSIDSLTGHIKADLINKIPNEQLNEFRKAFLNRNVPSKVVELNNTKDFDNELKLYLTNIILAAKELLETLAQNTTMLSDTHSISSQTDHPVQIIHDLIKDTPLTHDQIRNLWEILPEEKRRKYFKNQEITQDTVIKFQDNIDSAKVYKLAAKEKTNYSFVLTTAQNKQILSNLTLNQLERHNQLFYKHTAHTFESTLSTGTQYLSSWYVFLSNYLTIILGMLTATTIKLSLVLAAGLAFVGSLSLGLTIAWQQAVENYRKEAGLRMKHIINCLKINQLKYEHDEISAKQQNKTLALPSSPESVHRTPSHPNIQPNDNISRWSRFTAWFSSLRQLLHWLKPKQSGISPTAHAIITAFFIAVALLSGAYLFFTGIYALFVACAITAFISIIAGAVRYQTVKQERNMEAIVHSSEKELQKYKKANDELKKSYERLNAKEFDPSLNVDNLVQENAKLLRELELTKAQLAKMPTSVSNVSSLEQEQNLPGAHQRQHEQLEHKADHQGDTAYQNVALLSGGE